MNGKDLLSGLNYIDESLVSEAETKSIKKRHVRFMVPLAASFALMITAFSAWTLYYGNLPKQPGANIPPAIGDDTPKNEKKYTLYYNETDNQMVDSRVIAGYFWNELTHKQAKNILPIVADKYETNGTANYSHENGQTRIYSVDASFKVSTKPVKITIAPGEIPKCYIIDGKPILSEIEGVPIEAGMFITDKSSKGERNYIYYADFKMGDIAYYVEYSGAKNDKELFAGIVADIILGGEADLSVLEDPAVPELRDDELSESEAYSEADFGAYLPSIPSDYLLNGATRFVNQASDYLLASWSRGYDDVRIMVSKLTDEDSERVVDVQDTQLYNMALSPVAWADSMPQDKSYIIENPIFKIQDLTLDILKMREYVRTEQGESEKNSVNMRFGVLYGDVLTEITTEGVDTAYLLDELLKIGAKFS